MRRRRSPRVAEITDEALACFVEWCRTNRASIVEDLVIVRGVLNAYAAIPPLDGPPVPEAPAEAPTVH